jgi:predicted N-acetyltransferase YhbS
MSLHNPPALHIRAAEPRDDAAIGELLVESFVSAYARKLPDVVVTDERKAQLRDVAGKRAIARVLVAEQGGEVVGTVALWPPGAPGSEAWTPNTADLRHLAIAVKCQGQGLSKPLLDAIEAGAWESGVDAICLHTRRGATGVSSIYARRGFVRHPEGDIARPEVYLEAWLLPRR